jgi:hypothetical protein
VVEIRKLQPTIQIRKIVKPDPPSKNPSRVKVVRRARADYPPPTPQPTPCVIWQGGIDRDGYGRRQVKTKDGWRITPMHRWVVETMNGRKLGPKQVVMHRCDNRLCYRYDHLDVGTIQDNTADMIRKERNKPPPINHFTGSTNPNAKLNETGIAKVRELSEAGYYQRTIAQMMGISKSQVQRIIAGESWWHTHYPEAGRHLRGPRATEPGREPGPEPSDDGSGSELP